MYTARFKNGVLSGYQSTPKTLDEIKAIKTEEDCFEIIQEEYESLVNGYTATESGGVITFHKPDGWKHPDEIEAEEQARKDSVRDKLEVLGLTTDEIKSAFGI